MSDAAAILRLYDHARATGTPVVLATVVRTFGSTYRKPGARMMLGAGGSRVGVVSGGCLEGDVTRRAWFLKSPGDAELIRSDTGSGDDATYEFGLGCRGVVDIVVERLSLEHEPSIISQLRASVAERRTSTCRIDLAALPRARAEPIDLCDPIYHETIRPPIQLVVFGSGLDVSPVVRIAAELGWSVVVVDAKLQPGRFAPEVRALAKGPGEWMIDTRLDDRTACVLMTHRMMDDAGYLADVVRSGCGYIGCLGPVSRTEALFDELALAGVSIDEPERRRVHAPIGLDLHAERPQEIALAIVSEVAAALQGGSGLPLRERAGAIHDEADARPTP